MDWSYIKRRCARSLRRYRAFRLGRAQLERIGRVCLENARPVTQPIAWISQIQRSGGSLLSQLFDGHPELHAHPHEIKIGHPKKYHWPVIDPDERPERWFDRLFEESVIGFLEEGYRKDRGAAVRLPFVFLPALQRKIFLQHVGGSAPTDRRVIDAYMTSYFGAWLNNQNYVGPKAWVTGFTPRLFDDPANAAAFFAAYPDGLLIAVVRDPKDWFPSAARHNLKIKRDKYGDLNRAIAQWRASAQAIARNKQRYGERVRVLRFEELVGDTPGVMRRLSRAMGIRFDEVLLTPTFNRQPIEANTSFGRAPAGILKAAVGRHASLSGEELAAIEALTAEDYRRLREIAAADR
jgi:hypothetical protein